MISRTALQIDKGIVLATRDAVLLLSLDLHEHAHALDFADEANQYIDAFMGTLHCGHIDD